MAVRMTSIDMDEKTREWEAMLEARRSRSWAQVVIPFDGKRPSYAFKIADASRVLSD